MNGNVATGGRAKLTFRIAVSVVVLCVPAAPLLGHAQSAESKRLPIPDRLVVLTFDDSVRSHFTVARPVLKKYGFSATFFITEGFNFKTNKKDYMTWEQIRILHQDGFEIGNHTRDHFMVNALNVHRLAEQLKDINERCREHGIPKPVSFAWPGNAFAVEALDVLKSNGFIFARRGGSPEFPYEEGRGCAYEPGFDHPLLIPTAGDARPDWTLANFKQAIHQAQRGRIAVLQFHGVPEGEHDWVNTPKGNFLEYTRYLHENDFTVIAMRDLRKYVDPDQHPDDPLAAMKRRSAR